MWSNIGAVSRPVSAGWPPPRRAVRDADERFEVAEVEKNAEAVGPDRLPNGEQIVRVGTESAVVFDEQLQTVTVRDVGEGAQRLDERGTILAVCRRWWGSRC